MQHPYNISLKTDLDRINLIFQYFILFIYLLNLLVISSHIIHKRWKTKQLILIGSTLFILNLQPCATAVAYRG